MAILWDGVDKVTDATRDKLISRDEGTDSKDEKDKDVNADEKTPVCAGDDLIQKKTNMVKEPVVDNELLQVLIHICLIISSLASILSSFFVRVFCVFGVADHQNTNKSSLQYF